MSMVVFWLISVNNLDHVTLKIVALWHLKESFREKFRFLSGGLFFGGRTLNWNLIMLCGYYKIIIIFT